MSSLDLFSFIFFAWFLLNLENETLAITTEDKNMSNWISSLPVLPNLETAGKLPAKGQAGPDPPCPFYFFAQASCVHEINQFLNEKSQNLMYLRTYVE